MHSSGFDKLFWTNRLVDLAFLLDMGVTLNTVYQGADGQLVYDRQKILQRCTSLSASK